MQVTCKGWAILLTPQYFFIKKIGKFKNCLKFCVFSRKFFLPDELLHPVPRLVQRPFNVVCIQRPLLHLTILVHEST